MATQVGNTPNPLFDRLQTSAFVPAKVGKEIQLYRPTDVYFKKDEAPSELYASAFTFIDFGGQANVFLAYCGVRPEPSLKGRSRLGDPS